MTRISHRRLNKLLEERMYEIFWEHLAYLTKPIHIKDFLKSILSYNEQVIIAKRLAIAVLLARGYTYKEIDETLKVSMATVGTVHKQMLTGSSGYTQAIKAIQKRKAQAAFRDTFEETLLKLAPLSAEGSARYNQKSAQGKSLYIRKLKRQKI